MSNDLIQQEVQSNNTVDNNYTLSTLEEDPTKITNNILAGVNGIDEETAAVLAQTQALNNREQNRVMQAQLKHLEQEALKRELLARQQHEKMVEAQYFQAILKDVGKAIPDITKAEDFVNKLQDNEFMAEIAKAGHYTTFINAINTKNPNETINIIKNTFNKKTEEQMANAEIGGTNIPANSATKPNVFTSKAGSEQEFKRAADDLYKQSIRDGKLDKKAYKQALVDFFVPKQV